ncbi:hypothetical protein [Pseudoclavibacter sp. VKM Ac-2867]|uniref:hypothetical protein n=1 Tax=Pseudoclavibacter sp. VKM Ac-2867 TaxID=2783829 RepID=UPI001889D598|nr:hypothetical protein [Pseudoclavibacter sp. VKM Ac-2867]MBF4459485.1 hypothetical protein [Pseudoclavibacter sp. VKM Ac-2867]
MSATKRLTWPQYNALRALRDACDQPLGDTQTPAGKATPAQLARILWPDSAGWKRTSRRSSTPAGGALGATMPMKAATVLWRLRTLHLADLLPASRNRWEITAKGRASLTDERRLPAFVIGRDGTFEYLGLAHKLSRLDDGAYVVATTDDAESTSTFTLSNMQRAYPTIAQARADFSQALASGTPTLDAWMRERAH